jgi:hypothetical protein
MPKPGSLDFYTMFKGTVINQNPVLWTFHMLKSTIIYQDRFFEFRTGG